MFFSYLSQKSKPSQCLVLEYICIECVHYDLIFHIHVAISAEWPYSERGRFIIKNRSYILIHINPKAPLADDARTLSVIIFSW